MPRYHRNSSIHQINSDNLPSHYPKLRPMTSYRASKMDLFKKGIVITLGATAIGFGISLISIPIVGIATAFVAAGVLWSSITIE